MISIERYSSAFESEWNDFVAHSRNGTFLLHRSYLEYHQDRFTDHSLVLRSDSGDVAALLPANESGDRLHSHGGLTYGGLVLGPRTGAVTMLEMLQALKGYLRARSFLALHYKTIPWIYHRQPSEEDRYALFRLGATLTRRDVLSVVPREHRLAFQERRKRGVRQALKAGICVVESRSFARFWAVLDDNLRQRYGVGPVHSLAEIELLHARFPHAIRLFEAHAAGEVVAGVVIYDSPNVAHVQYISSSGAGRKLHALDALFDHLLTTVFPDKPYFDFGISNEDQGRVLNSGLVEQKEGFGARTVVHDFYELAA